MTGATDLSCSVVMPSGPGTDTRRRVNASLTSMTEQLISKPFGLPRGHKEILVELKLFTNSLLNASAIMISS